MTDVIAAWDTALDDFEAMLARCEGVLDPDSEAEAPATFEPPAVEGPLPGELAARARDLLDRAAELTGRLEAERSQVREDLAKVPRRRADRAAPTARFEAHA